jgi:two-component system CheB/CheR fusion protein
VATNTSPPLSVLDTDFSLVHEALPLIEATTGVDFGGYRLPMVRRRLRAHMLVLGVADEQEYVRQLRQLPALRVAALERITIKVSGFFRNPKAFEQLERMLPSIPEPCVMWVAGCGTGEEAWSLAMLTTHVGMAAMIIATDIDRAALHTAEEGRYSAHALGDLPPWSHALVTPTEGKQIAIDDRLRSRVRFVTHDLTREPPPVTGASLVSCRNVMIYFQSAYQEVARDHLLAALAPGGVLFLGEAEWLPPARLEALHIEHATHRLFRRRTSLFSA